MSDKERDSIQEMEDIQKGLEAFLQQELQEMQTSGSGSGKSGTGRGREPAAVRGARRRMWGHTLRSVRQQDVLHRRCMI